MRLFHLWSLGLLPLVLSLPGCPSKNSTAPSAEEKAPSYSGGSLQEPVLSYKSPAYAFAPKKYDNEEYPLPLKEIPENYRRDVSGKFKLELSDKQAKQLLKNGVVVVPGKLERFEHAYKGLSNAKQYQEGGQQKWDESGVPIVITTDSVMHLFHIEFNELLKNIEINKLTPMLKTLLVKAIGVSLGQIEGLRDERLKELARRNVAYLSVAMKLLVPDFDVPGAVKDDVEREIGRIEAHGGFFKNELFSKDCPSVCAQQLYKAGSCTLEVKGDVIYQGKSWRFQDLYREVCSKSCACEDYSQYVPRGHYTASEGLKRYFKAMMWLGRMTFKASGEGWTKGAVLLTDAVKAAGVVDLWMTIYTVTGFFAGASDDLTFYDYDTAVARLLGYGFDEDEKLIGDIAGDLQKQIGELRGPEILGGFEFDLGGKLKDATQGLRLIGQRYAVDSHVLSEMVYNNVGPNPQAPKYRNVVDCRQSEQALSQPAEFYLSCRNMEKDRIKYWNEVCSRAVAMHLYGLCGGLNEEELYGVCRFMPTGLDVMSALGSRTADEIMAGRKISTYCDYDEKIRKMKDLVAGYDQKKWTENLYNAWLWMIQPVLGEKGKGYPNWMRSGLWRKKELVTALASWAQLRHDTILYVKQSYTRAVMMAAESAAPRPMESKYYGYVEPNPELYARAGFLVEFLQTGLEEQKVMTPEVKQALQASGGMMGRLRQISEKELLGEALSEEDYDYIERINEVFDRIITDLASALKVEEQKPDGPVETHTDLAGKEDAFKTTIVADVHTESNTKKVLEVGSGYVDWVIIAHAAKDGRIGLAVGPMFSYYEFPHPMADRLTDEKWRELLSTKPPARPAWIADFME
jgi:hypothetical protein